MPIRAQIDASAILKGPDAPDLTGGTLPPTQVMIQFICNTNAGHVEHDPDKPPDDKVRPSHAALHGRLFTLDTAPIPPLSYNCRCAIRYLAVPKTDAAKVLDTAPIKEKPETSVVPAFKEYLDDAHPKWREVAQAAAKAQPPERIIKANEKASDLGMTRDEAQMALTASPYAEKTFGPVGIGRFSGVGRSARRLIQAWRTGDLTAALKLMRSYPATYRRLLIESPELLKAPNG